MTLPNNEERGKDLDKSQGPKREDIPPEYLGSVLRAEIMPASEVAPDRPGIKTYLGRVNLGQVALVIIVLLLIGAILICSLGPGKPRLENALNSLKSRYIQSTTTNTPTVIPVISKTPQVSPSSTSTPPDTFTPIPPSETPTYAPASTPTEDDGCVNAVEVTLDDVGSRLCVRGTITGLEEREVGFIIYFSDERGLFYLVTYDLVWDDGEPGDCIQITGEIQQLGSTPVLVFGWNNLPQACP